MRSTAIVRAQPCSALLRITYRSPCDPRAAERVNRSAVRFHSGITMSSPCIESKYSEWVRVFKRPLDRF